MQLVERNKLTHHRSPILTVLGTLEDTSIDAIFASFPPPQSYIYPYLSHVVRVGREFQRILKDPGALWISAQDYTYQPVAKRDEVMGERFAAKREKGITSVRKDGSECDKENDILAAAAEKLVCDRLGRKFDNGIYWHGDDADCYLHGAKVDIKLRRRAGDDIELLINPNDKPKDIYILVSGTKLDNLTCWGYTTHQELQRQPKRNFGYGSKLRMNCRELRPIDDLLALTAHPKPGELLMLPHRIVSQLQADGWWLHTYNSESFLLSPTRYLPYWAKLQLSSLHLQKVLVFGDEKIATTLSQTNEVTLIQP